MHSNYRDILDRINEEPSWYDENGTPRYGEFAPDMCPNIYAHSVVLLEIACQSCGRRFRVEMNEGPWLPSDIPPKNWHYGDPPAHGCVGDTMNCDDLVILIGHAHPPPPPYSHLESPCFTRHTQHSIGFALKASKDS